MTQSTIELFFSVSRFVMMDDVFIITSFKRLVIAASEISLSAAGIRSAVDMADAFSTALRMVRTTLSSVSASVEQSLHPIEKLLKCKSQ